jgi:ADP-ribosyl-[dinitrogen reductase] hydrolase
MKLNRTPGSTGLEETMSSVRDVLEDMSGAAAAAARRGTFKGSDRLTGMLMGCAIGDALGMPVEGLDNEQTMRAIRRLGGIRDFLAPQGHVLRSLRKLRPGCWTDDTQLTMAISRSLIEQHGNLDYDSIARAHVHAFETLELRGWESTTKQACRRLAQGTERARSGKLGGAGNSVAMKIAPVAAWSYLRGESRDELLRHCLQIGIMTHHDPRSIVGAYLVALLVRDALASQRKWDPAAERYEELIAEAAWAEEQLAHRIGSSDDPISQHLSELHDALDVDSVELAEFCNGADSYVCHSIPYCIALLCGRAWEFEDGVIAAVNGGGDTDTNGAIVGSVLGAAYGFKKLPRRFVDKVEEPELLRSLGAQLATALQC